MVFGQGKIAKWTVELNKKSHETTGLKLYAYQQFEWDLVMLAED